MKRLLLILSALLCTLVLRAQEDILSSLEKANGGRSFSALFTMTRRSSMLSGDLVTTGRISVIPPTKLRWETFTPSESVFIMDGDLVRLPDGSSRSASESGMPGRLPDLSARLFDPALFDMSAERTGGGWKVSMRPKRRDLKRLFSEIYVYTSELYIMAIELFNPSGDSTLIEFSGMEWDIKDDGRIFDAGR
ncbi:MAG: outer membrane lipoprotein carrier protein LolA [Bacteroidales bacterium]|nr:outer membrane lipoprotein carrier protein LolA [Bacteroidales bacterium]